MKKFIAVLLVSLMVMCSLCARSVDADFLQVVSYDSPVREWKNGFKIDRLTYSLEGRVGIKVFQTTFGVGVSPNSYFVFGNDPFYQLAMLNGFATVGAKFDLGQLRLGFGVGERLCGCWTSERKLGYYDKDGEKIVSDRFADVLLNSDLMLKANVDLALINMVVGLEITSAPKLCINGFGKRIVNLSLMDFVNGSSVGVSFGHRF